MSIHKRAFTTIAIFLIAALLFGAGCAAPGTQVKEGQPAAAQLSSEGLVIRDIRSIESEGVVVLIVEASKPLSYSMFELKSPSRLAIDLPGADMKAFSRNIPVNRGPVSFVKPIPYGKDEAVGARISRLEIYLSQPALYEASTEDSTLKVTLSGREESYAEEAEEMVSSEETTIDIIEPADMPVSQEETAMVEEPEPEPEPETAEEAAATRLTMLDVVAFPQGTQVIIEGNGTLEHEYFLVESRSLVVDFYSVDNSISPMRRLVNDKFIKQIRIGEHFQPRRKVRVVMDLAGQAEYKVVALGDKILINFGDLSKESDEAIIKTVSNMINDVYFRPLEGRSLLEIVMDGPAQYSTVDSDDPNRLVIEVSNSRVAAQAQKTLDLGSLNREISKITSFQYEKEGQPVARIAAQFKTMVPYRINAIDNRIIVEVPRVETAKAVEEPPAPSIEEPMPVAVVAAAPAPIEQTQVLETEEQPEAVRETEPGPLPYETAQERFTGRPLSLDFKDAEISDVLRLIAEVSGINFVSGSEVKGNVTIRLTDIPWDQALNVILKSNTPQLTQIREAENIIRITTMENVRREENDRQKLEQAKVAAAKTKIELEPLVTKSIHISYAKVDEINTRVEKFMSPRRGTDAFIQTDERTNTLIVRDLKANVDEIEKVVKQLDAPTPAVQIEARIVTVSSNYTQDLGIQWGFNYSADTAHGNATNLEFPNSISLGGAAGAAGENLLVNLPAAAATSGMGISLGHIANTLTLDLRLSAMEQMGQVEILSNPKVFVVQNEKALINIGRELPIPKTDAEGNRTVEFKPVGIKLEVSPQVTADNRVFLDVVVERSDKGEDVNTTEGAQFSIISEKAETKVLLNNGETSVIGGLFQQTKSGSSGGVPGLSKLPLIGWLFKSKSTFDARQELLIFLTPKIVMPE